MSSEYIPGSCNIGTGEIKRRQAVALFGLFLTIFSITTILATDQNKSARLSIFIPAMIFSVGFNKALSGRDNIILGGLAALITAVFFVIPL